jgi:hypothetical protein
VQLNKSNRSKQHTIPRWIVRRLECEEDGYLSQTLTYPNAPHEALAERAHSINALVLGNVCADCNNGWMSLLEVDTTPLLEALWKPVSPTLLTPDECLTVARWTFKTAATVAYSSEYKKIIPIQHVHDFFNTQRLPTNSTVDLAYGARGDRLIQCLQGGNKQFALRDLQPAKADLAKSYLITLHFHHVMLRLAWTPIDGIKAQPVPKDAVFRLFPPPDRALFVQLIKGQVFRDHFQFHFVATMFGEDGLYDDALPQAPT